MSWMQAFASALNQVCLRIRHSEWLEEAEWLWNNLRPAYDTLMGVIGREGLRRVINGMDEVILLPRFRSISAYEPEYYSHLMAQMRPGDVVADVGAHIGLYTVVLAKRVGPEGKVIAFEPDPENFKTLSTHCHLNRVTDRVELIPAAVSDRDGEVAFAVGKGSESAVALCSQGDGVIHVPCVKLDTVFHDRAVSILKVDVEGYEEAVLRGATELLSDPVRRLRLISLELHPFAWPRFGTTHEALLGLLRELGYNAESPDGRPPESIHHWGWIIAVPS